MIAQLPVLIRTLNLHQLLITGTRSPSPVHSPSSRCQQSVAKNQHPVTMKDAWDTVDRLKEFLAQHGKQVDNYTDELDDQKISSPGKTPRTPESEGKEEQLRDNFLLRHFNIKLKSRRSPKQRHIKSISSPVISSHPSPKQQHGTINSPSKDFRNRLHHVPSPSLKKSQRPTSPLASPPSTSPKKKSHEEDHHKAIQHNVQSPKKQQMKMKMKVMMSPKQPQQHREGFHNVRLKIASHREA